MLPALSLFPKAPRCACRAIMSRWMLSLSLLSLLKRDSVSLSVRVAVPLVPALLPRLTLNFNISLLKDPIRSNADRVFFVCYLDMQNHSLYITQRLSCVKGTFGLSKNASPVFGCGCPADTSAKQKHRPRRQPRRWIAKL